MWSSVPDAGAPSQTRTECWFHEAGLEASPPHRRQSSSDKLPPRSMRGAQITRSHRHMAAELSASALALRKHPPKQSTGWMSQAVDVLLSDAVEPP
jgi:hypothetical protein